MTFRVFASRTLPLRLQNWLRSQRHVDEVAMIAWAARNETGVMVDVGAHIGGSTAHFLALGWQVMAYEPDPKNRAMFEKTMGWRRGVKLSKDAVSDGEADNLPFFSSDVSTGISSLQQFHESHSATARVKAVTLAKDLPRQGILQVDFLKIDVEGHDFAALRGFDWSLRPRFVLYEFEDRKTIKIGHTLADSAAYMIGHGYKLLYSVWEPIVEYGQNHTWRGLYEAPPLDVAESWGNVLCFLNDADRDQVLQRYAR